MTVIFEQFPDKLFSEGTEELIRECLDGLLKIRIHFPGFKYPMRPYANQTASTLKTMAFTFTIDFFNRSTSLGAPATLWWRELAVTVIFGLLFATVLTLVVTPCALALKARAKDSKVKWAQRWRSVLRPRTTFSIDRRKPQPPAPRSPAE